jgi:hypothetical protein
MRVVQRRSKSLFCRIFEPEKWHPLFLKTLYRAKGLFRPADAGRLDYPHEAGNDGVEGTGSQFRLPT